MTDKKILEGNKLIAEFMNYDDVDCDLCKYKYDCNWLQCGLDSMEKEELLAYHKSWNVLMPVIEKISDLKYVDEFRIVYDASGVLDIVEIYPAYRDTFEPMMSEAESKIEAVWRVCVEFIEWYNENAKDMK